MYYIDYVLSLYAFIIFFNKICILYVKAHCFNNTQKSESLQKNLLFTHRAKVILDVSPNIL